MSGIVGIIHPGGHEVDQTLVCALTRFLSYRGPDDQGVWCGRSVGFGHAMLRTTEESAHERQPACLGRRFWITADARLDARADLIAALQQAGFDPARSAPDCELILHAYAAWGEQCLHHLLGDFAFGIWDAQTNSLFCARDHFGIKPFYYAEGKDFFLFSNTLDCVRMHPDIPDELNESAIADFLLFGLNCDAATTTFRGIRRLPPAHFLRVSAEGLTIERYWSVPIDGRIRYRHHDQYVEQFRLLLREAVSDRLRGGSVCVLLSGGLDSSSVAATASELRPNREDSKSVRAYTAIFETLLRDDDGPYAREVAEYLGIPVRFVAMDGLRLFERWDDPVLRWPEPVDDPLMGGLFAQFQAIAADCRVALDCEGADNLMLFQIRPYLRDLMRNREWRQLCAVLPRYLLRRPSLIRGAFRRARRLLGADSGEPKFPEWIDPEFARRVSAKERWRNGCSVRPTPAHPVVPAAHASLSLPQWQWLFELQNPGVTRCFVETRYPFLDLRIVNYVLALPPFPWSFQKTLLREAMTGHLPERVLHRPKTVPELSPLAAVLQRADPAWISQTQWNKEAVRFVNLSALPSPRAERSSWAGEMAMRPFCLNFWLQHSRPIRYKLMPEARNG